VPVKGVSKTKGGGLLKVESGIAPRTRGPLGISGPVGDGAEKALERIARAIEEDLESSRVFRTRMAEAVEGLSAQLGKVSDEVGGLAATLFEGQNENAKIMDRMGYEVSRGNEILVGGLKEICYLLDRKEQGAGETGETEETMGTN
jgi:hypothetical protein